jgi:hypothetical protein
MEGDRITITNKEEMGENGLRWRNDRFWPELFQLLDNIE